MATVFLDLDGTLTDPAEGIIGSVTYALTALGLDAPAPEALTWVIGPPLLHSFERLGVENPDAALALYRERFSTEGLFKNRPYPGVIDALTSLSARHDLFLATAKPHVFARRITAHFGLDRFLRDQFGPELDGTRNDKGELLAHALGVTGARPETSVMVGDRHHDIDAAHAVGMASVAVTWGFGSTAEHAGASVICETMDALAQTVEEGLRSRAS